MCHEALWTRPESLHNIFFILSTYSNEELPPKAENFAIETDGCMCVLTSSCIVE